jgi:HlyD family secretion protein
VKRKLIIGLGALIVVVVIVVVNLRRESPEAKVEMVTIGRRDLEEVVTASGTIRPKRSVDVSANAMGTITRLAVVEGQRVRLGDFLLEIDPSEYRSAVQALEAAVASAEADLELAVASREKAEIDFGRARDLSDEGLISEEELTTARTNYKVEQARVEAARHRLRQQTANLEKARHDLAEVTITAPMSGIVTRLNVEEGESAIMGTLNVPGTVLLTIADLDTMEAEVEVDETEVVDVAIGQTSEVEIDAFPEQTFTGRVTEIGNSPILSGTGASQEAVDFKVTITLDSAPAAIRPGLSAKADITVAVRNDVLAVPLEAVTVRPWPLRPADKRIYSGGRGREQAAALEPLGFTASSGAGRDEPAGGSAGEGTTSGDTAGADTARAASAPAEVERKDIEGVFVVRDGFAAFVPVELGITGKEDFEVLSGLEAGERIVSGPFRVLRELKSGVSVEAREHDGGREDRE